MAAQQQQTEQGIEELIAPKVIQKQVKLITTVKEAIDLMKKDSNYPFEIISTHGTIAGASRLDTATVVFEDAQGFVEYVKYLKRCENHPLLVLRGEIVIPNGYNIGTSGFTTSGIKFDDGLAYLEHLPKVQAYFIPKKQ